MQRLILIILYLGIKNCATPNNLWWLNGKTNDQFNRDCEYCTHYARQWAQHYVKTSEYAAQQTFFLGFQYQLGLALVAALNQHNFAVYKFNESMKNMGYATVKER